MSPTTRLSPVMQPSIVLTGATGFLGSALLRRLLQSGRSVICTIRSTSRRDRIADLLQSPNLTLVDSASEGLEDAFRQYHVGTVIHTATEYGRGQTPLASILDSNLILPIRLAELGVKYGVRGFINTDSYFNKPGSSYSNLLNYSLSKRTLLVWLEKLSSQISITNVVLEHLYGPNDNRTKFVEDMIRSIAIEHRPSVRLTHGHQKRDFIFVSDVVDAFMRILVHIENHEFNFKKFEVGCGEGIQIRDFVSTIAEISRSPTRLDFGAIDYRDDEIMNSRADIRDMLDLGWKPMIKPAEGIRNIVQAYGGTTS